MRKIRLFVIGALSFFVLLIWGSVVWGQGFEDFENSNASASYVDGSFIGNDGITWNYFHSRNEGDYPIDGKGIMLRRSDEPSSISATLSGGIKSFSVDTRKAFTGNSQRRMELVINGEVVEQFEPTFGSGGDDTVIPFVVENINVEGEFTLTLRMYGNAGNQQIVIDNLSWTGYPDDVPPAATFYPENGSIGVPLNIQPTITFTKPIYTTPAGEEVTNSNVESILSFTANGADVPFAATIEQRVITVVPVNNLEFDTDYTLTIAAVEDASGNAMDAPTAITFTTVDATTPTLVVTGDYPGPYYAGDQFTLTWEAANIDQVKVDVWMPDTENWLPAVEGTIDASAGETVITVHPTTQFGVGYKLRVSGTADGDPSDETNQFTLREVHTNLASLRQRPNNTELRFDGEAIVTYSRETRNQKYIQDDASAVLIDDAGGIIVQEYPIGSAITGLVGKINIYNQLVQFIPLEDSGAPVSFDNPVVPFETNLNDLNSADQSKLVRLENVHFVSTGTFALNQNYTISDADEATAIYRAAFAEADYIGEEIPTSNMVEMLVLVGQFNNDIQLTSRGMDDWLIISNDATLTTFKLGGSDALQLTGVMVDNPEMDEGAILYVDDFEQFVGIEIETSHHLAVVEVKLNDEIVPEENWSTYALEDNDVVVVSVTAEDNVTKVYYKVFITGENRQLTLIAPIGASTFETGEDIVFSWTSENIDNVNLYMVDGDNAELINAEGPVNATAGSFTYSVPNGLFGSFKFRVADALDAEFYDETDVASTIIDNMPPVPIALYPIPGSEDMLTALILRAEFNEKIQKGQGQLTILKTADASVVQTHNADELIIENNVATLLVTGLPAETQLYINIDEGLLKDMAGNLVSAVTDNTTWYFATATMPDTELFFSEYVEGSSFNKALEIFNPTPNPVDLSEYKVIKYLNGGDAPNQTLQLSGTLNSGEVFVIAHGSAAQAIKDVADLIEGDNGVTNFNGNDAVGLFKGELLIDIIGETVLSGNGSSSHPDFDAAGVVGAGKDHTLVRKIDILIGNPDWDSSAGTNAENSEWIVYPKDTFSYLGWHAPSSEANFLSFYLINQTGPATINYGASTISIEVINGTDLTALVPTFTLSAGAKAYVGGIEQESGVSQVNFTNPVSYTVIAEDATTQKIWTVTVTESMELSNKAEIISFTVANQIDNTIIDSEAATVTLTVDGDVTQLIPTIVISPGATINPASGVAQDFSQAVLYTVTAQNGVTSKVWTVTVNVVDILPIYNIQYTQDPSGDSPYKGQVVTTQGVVTAHHYNHQGGVFQGIFIQDGPGAWNGLYVYEKEMANIPNVGDMIIVTGKVEEYYTLTELTSAGGTIDMNVTVVSSGNQLPEPVLLTTHEAAQEPWEGVLVSVENAQYIIPADNYNVLGVNDGSGLVYVDDDMYNYMDMFHLYERYNITGIGHFSYDYPKILPRFASDIKQVTGIESNWGQNIAIYPNPFNNTLWIDNVSYGDVVLVYNVMGQLLLHKNIENATSIAIATDHFQSGVYLVAIRSINGHEVVRKLIKR